MGIIKHAGDLTSKIKSNFTPLNKLFEIISSVYYGISYFIDYPINNEEEVNSLINIKLVFKRIVDFFLLFAILLAVIFITIISRGVFLVLLLTFYYGSTERK